MHEINEEKLSSMCRLCLNDKCDWLLRVRDDLIAKVELADIRIFETPQLPQKICNICLKTLNGFYDFKIKCKDSENLLHKKFPHLINDAKLITPEFFQVLITESRLETEPQDPELLLIKEEILECDGIKSYENPIISEEITVEDSHPVSDTSSPKIKQPKKKKILGEKKKSEPKVKKSSVRKERKKKMVHPCHLCGKTYTKTELEMHLNAHNNIRPLKCEFEGCDKSFIRRKTFRMHQQIHYKCDLVCDICQKIYQTDRALTDHKNLRHIDPYVPCGQCDMKFKSNKCLKKHMMRHTRERNYPCKFCPKAFATAYNLKVHTRIHTGDKPFTCEPCGVSFAYNSLMKAHNEKHHPVYKID